MASEAVTGRSRLLPVLTCQRGDLSVKRLEGEPWKRLESLTGDRRHNCRGVVFDGGVTVVQKDPESNGICTVKFLVESPSVIFDQSRDRLVHVVEATCVGIEGPEFDSNAPGDKTPGVEAAKAFPLAHLNPPIGFIKIDYLQKGNFSRKLDPDQYIDQITTLMASKARGDAATDAGVFLQQLSQVSIAERDFQTERILRQTGCRVVLQPTKRGTQLELRAWPRVDPEARDVDIQSDDLPNRFLVVNHHMLTDQNLRPHPIRGRETEGWEINIIKSSAAPVVGVIANSFQDRTDMLSFVGHAKGITLEPIVHDVLGGLDFNEVSAHLDPTKALSQLPLDSLFLVGKTVPTREELAITGVPPPPLRWDDGLKDRQREAVKLSIMHSLSAVHGPPGTGKSKVAARIVFCLLNSQEKTLCSAPTIVALDSLLSGCAKECRAFGMHNPPFVRVWSQSQIMAQYAEGNSAVLDHEFHIENLRLIKAGADPNRFARYLEAFQRLKDFGVINNAQLFQDWSSATKILTRQVMEDARVAFCTTAGLSSPALCSVQQGVRTAWPATSWLLDEASQANPDAILLGLVTYSPTLKRFTMLGDYLQLKPFKGSLLAQRVYRQSFLETFCVRGFPVELLNHQFRALDLCMWPVNMVVYDGKLSSEFNLAKPGPLGTAYNHLRSILPLRFTVDRLQYDVTALHNFIDVADGKQFVAERGLSSGNLQEVQTVSALVKALERHGKKLTDICVLSAHRTQLKYLREEAARAQWLDCFINTIDNSQGQEFDIVIISLVKTEGNAGLIERLEKASVATSRHKIAMYLVGNWRYWTSNLGQARGQHHRTFTEIIQFMRQKSGPNRDTPALPVSGKPIHSVPSEPQPVFLPSRSLTRPPVPSPSQNEAARRRDDADEKRARNREVLLDRMTRLKADGEDAVSRKLAELAARREEAIAGAIAALNVEHDRIMEEELGRLRTIQASEEERIQRALDSI